MRNLVSGLFLFFFGILLFLHSKNLSLWGDMGPGEGFFPFLLSIALCVLSLVIVIQAFLIKFQGNLKILGPKKWKFFAYIISFFSFSLFFGILGYSLTISVILFFLFRIVERQSLKKTILFVFFSVLASKLIFTVFLRIYIPEGILSPINNIFMK